MKRPTVAILFGGKSDEYEISLLSADTVFSHIDRKKWRVLPIGITRQGKWYLYRGCLCRIKEDLWHQKKKYLTPIRFAHGALLCGRKRIRPQAILPVLHGGQGEGGDVQGLLESLALPYLGCQTAASAACMDKAHTKAILKEAGIPVAKGICLFAQKEDLLFACHAITDALSFPLFIKPARGGSSLGASLVRNEAELSAALRYALLYDTRILAEEYVKGKECEVAVFEENGRLTVSVPGEIEPGTAFYDYRTKYHSNTAKLHVPARVDQTAAEQMREYAKQAFMALGCRHISRFDFFVKENGEVLLNEVNTLPGLTKHSLYPALLADAGIDMASFLDRLLEASL